MVVECDQAQAIHTKQKIASDNFPTEHVKFVPLDLNDTEWPEFSRLLDEKSQKPVLVMMEGVSPYISSESFAAFLGLLASKLHVHSLLAYDFKIAGALDDFGQSARAQQPFRLPAIKKEADAFHEPLGFRVERMELGAELSKRLLPDTALQFDEDCLLQLTLRE
jgi:O-methyltransferase involved in polyketide biosynthesis